MTDATDPAKPVAWTDKWQFGRLRDKPVEPLTMWSEAVCDGEDAPLYGPSLLSEYERATARSEALEAENKRLSGLLNDTVVAWEALPGGQQSVKVVEKWLAEKMSTAINRIRAALEASR